MPDASHRYRLYDDLARWWPLLAPPAEFTEEAAYAATVLESGSRHVRDVLELGSGGGNNASHLKHRFDMTLVDLSERMLDVSRSLNPECEHVVGDMRTVRLDRTFDAVFVHDAIDYITSPDQLSQVIATARAHCQPGGVAVFIPDATAETFEENTMHGGHDGPDGAAARYFQWAWDPDPEDTSARADYVFMLRTAGGSVEVVHETHDIGVFARADWLRLLDDNDWDPVWLTEQTAEDRMPRDVFIGRHRGT